MIRIGVSAAKEIRKLRNVCEMFEQKHENFAKEIAIVLSLLELVVDVLDVISHKKMVTVQVIMFR